MNPAGMPEMDILDEAALRAALPLPAAIDALETAFAQQDITAPPRSQHAAPGGDLLLMPAASRHGSGVKLLTVAPANPARGLPLIHGLYVLFEPESLRPTALVDGAALTALRTAAVSGMAARRLARPNSTQLVIFGAGTQARSHVEALRAVCPVRRVRIVSRTPARAEALAAELRADGVDAAVGGAEAVRDADLVATCTTSDQPVLHGADLRPGAHVTAVGAYTPGARELDTAALRRGRVVVEDRDAALESGDLRIPIDEGAFAADDIAADLAELAAGAAVRRSPEDITIFKSVGLAMEDLAVVIAAVRAHRDRRAAPGGSGG